MNEELALMNRITLLKSRDGRNNGRIIAKLERRLRQIRGK